MLTFRAVLLLLFAAPMIAAATWVPVFRWLALLYVAFCLSLITFDRWRARAVSRFEISRHHDSKLSLGAENAITLKVRNLSGRQAIFQVRDEPSERFITSQLLFAGTVGPFAEWQTVYHVRPLRRGDYRFGDFTLRWQGPLGLFTRQATIKAIAPVRVYPNLIDVRRYDLLLRNNRLQELGLRNTRQFGEGTEYERLREYLPDDDFRRINWKATARRQRPVTVEYQTERSQNIIALVDVGRMMQSPVAHMAKLDYVLNAVLLLAYVATGVGDKVGLLTFADDIQTYLNPRQGRGQFYRMLELLYGVEAQPVEPDYERALNYLMLKQRKRALVLLFTDLSGGFSMQSLTAQVSLLAKKSLPLVVTISDPDVVTMARSRPQNSQSVYQQAAATRLLDERQLALDSLRRHGVQTLDVPANQLSTSVINRYLQLKGTMRL